MKTVSKIQHIAAKVVLQIEKPFGHDLESSRELQRALDPNWREDEIFRVDHYLGKEVVNNLLVLRFGNEMFGAIWNARHIDNIEVGSIFSETTFQPLIRYQISITEAGGAEGRGSYFNGVGAIRDVMQNRKYLPCSRICVSHRHRRSNADTRTAHNGATTIVLSGRLVRRKGTHPLQYESTFYSCLCFLGPSLGLDAAHRARQHHHWPVRQIQRWQEARFQRRERCPR